MTIMQALPKKYKNFTENFDMLTGEQRNVQNLINRVMAREAEEYDDEEAKPSSPRSTSDATIKATTTTTSAAKMNQAIDYCNLEIAQGQEKATATIANILVTTLANAGNYSARKQRAIATKMLYHLWRFDRTIQPAIQARSQIIYKTQ